MDSFTFTVGKLDAGMAILIGERAHLIEFPSLLLPPGVTSGSIVNISVHRNHAEEKRQKNEFWDLQKQIFETFGVNNPKPPVLNVRNTTQTSVTLEWPPIELATAKLRSLDIYRNGQRLASIPSPLQNTSTKLSGLALSTEYTFQLIMRTTAGTYPSNLIKLKTHTMSDTSGISVCFGNVQDPVLLENAKLALEDMKAKWSDKVQIDTTHFVCTTPAATPSGAQATGNVSNAPGVEYQKALQASIPIVQPQWILACHREHKMVPISQYYLGASSSAGLQSAPFVRPSSNKLANTSLSSVSGTQSPPTSSQFVNQSGQPPRSPESRARAVEGEYGHGHTDSTGSKSPPAIRTSQSQQSAPAEIAVTSADDSEQSMSPVSPEDSSRSGKPPRRRNGTMQRDFKFPGPSPTSTTAPPLPQANANSSANATLDEVAEPPSVDIPPPAPVPKDRHMSPGGDDDDLGETEEVDLN
ncbi:Chitin synthase, class 5 [Tulasnella sp. 419]|nr:Chitin synthase, class 5 [Tulasnella sp. 419]